MTPSRPGPLTLRFLPQTTGSPMISSDPMTQAQVAERLGCSQMQVSRIQSRALDFLRQRLLAD